VDTNAYLVGCIGVLLIGNLKGTVFRSLKKMGTDCESQSNVVVAVSHKKVVLDRVRRRWAKKKQ
jgi:hypothetical protein